MNFATKSLIGTLSSGAVAVGGDVIYSSATGKPGFIFGTSKTPEENQSNPVQPNNEQSTEQQKLQTLLNEINKGCEIKVNENNNTRPINNSSTENNLSNLITTLETIKDKCKTQKENKETIVLKNNSEAWQELTEKEYIEELIKLNSFKCEIKIKVSESQFKTINDATDTEITGLLKKLKELEKNGCQNSLGSKTHKILKKESNSWEELSEKDEINAWKSSAQCTLKIFKNYESQDIVDESDLNGLYNFLKTDTTIKTTCSQATSGDKPEVVVKKENQTWKIMDERDQILELKKDTTNFKCAIKIKNNSSEEGTEISSDTDQNSIKGLLKKIKEVKDAKCKGDSITNLIFHKNDEEWSVYETNKDKISKLIGEESFKCTVKVKTLDNSSNEQDWTVVTNETSLAKLLEELTKLKNSECASTTNPKAKVVFREESGNSWTKEEATST